MLLITPVAGAVASVAKLGAVWALPYLAAAVACVAVGITSRTHAPLVGAAVHVGIAVATLVRHDMLPWRPEWQVIVGGAIVLALSAALSRGLHERRTGIVVTPEALTPYDDAVTTVGAMGFQVQPVSAEAPAPERGGQFGGAGASSHF